MRVVLLYPPPWKVSEKGFANDPLDGPPEGFQPTDLDPDFHQTPYGLFSLAAQAIDAGHQVKVINLSSYPWSETESVLQKLEADVFGLSCWTANRRGVDLVSRLIKRLYPKAHVVVGGPHATPLAREVLTHYTAIDTVCIGESEEQFLELLARKQHGQPLTGIAGTFYREGNNVIEGPPRANIADLDTLVSPHRYFDTHIVMTSRGCPWQCTFCGAETTWGRGFRGQSIDYVVDAISLALERVPVKLLQIKDDTFTANKKRALEICQGIRKRGLQFLWSCDTRVDVLTEELLREMRLAGCQRLSLGVESGSPRILKAINKKITAEKIIEAAEMAKKYGIHVRFYMMLGNRGETRETFYETLDFLERARPHQYLFSCLSIYPGTVDFQDAEAAGWLDRKIYFTEKFQEYKVPFDATPEDAALMSEWFSKNRGVQNSYRASIEDCEAILERLGDHHAAYVDLAGAHYRAGNFEQAELHLARALELGFPTPGLIHNYRAAMAAKRSDLKAAQEHLRLALRTDPYHYPVARNAEAMRRFLADSAAGPRKLELEAYHEFQLFERTTQPTLPGALSEQFSHWQAEASHVVAPALLARRLPMIRAEA